MKLTEFVDLAPAHICIYGPPKSGKTWLIGMLAEKYKLWWFDLEGGVKTLTQAGYPAKEHIGNVVYFRIPDTVEFPISPGTMLKVLKGGANGSVCHGHGKFNCPICKDPSLKTAINVDEFDIAKDILVIDSMSQLADSVMNMCMASEIKKENWDAKPGWDEFAKQGNLIAAIGSRIQTAKFNVIVTSHEAMVKMEDGNSRLCPVGGTDNKSRNFAKYFDDVIYTEVIGGKYRAYSLAGEKNGAVIGSRAGKSLTGANKEQLGLMELFK